MLKSVYIESSVISYLMARPSRDLVTAARQSITSEWWELQRKHYDLFVSPLVEQEISGGSSEAAALRMQAIAGIPNLEVTVAAQALANLLLVKKAVPLNSDRDALHIAIAATQGIHYLLTWNFKHINNAATKSLIAQVIESEGYTNPVLCSPEELGETPHDT